MSEEIKEQTLENINKLEKAKFLKEKIHLLLQNLMFQIIVLKLRIILKPLMKKQYHLQADLC